MTLLNDFPLFRRRVLPLCFYNDMIKWSFVWVCYKNWHNRENKKCPQWKFYTHKYALPGIMNESIVPIYVCNTPLFSIVVYFNNLLPSVENCNFPYIIILTVFCVLRHWEHLLQMVKIKTIVVFTQKSQDDLLKIKRAFPDFVPHPSVYPSIPFYILTTIGGNEYLYVLYEEI